ncbi:hypothetical protein CYY_009790 [Polysphondylium violaceum]|uniref:thioredoxin-dependent peroxiredoxin n=1 Tax=Polysphondylium violaceum TaxID=133409 RepID=A0A8J4PMB7_9MYCE|nr:hypothetical protein CYY_009790 [Polysphondylium violaceum]
MTKLTGLSVGDQAPEFSAIDRDGNPVTLADYKDKILVLYFYGGNIGIICQKEACTFRDHYQEFIDSGAEVVGVSPDGLESHQRFTAKNNIPFKLISDKSGALAKAFKVPKDLFIIPGRHTFIIDQNQKIAMSFNNQLNASAHIEESLKVIEKLKSGGSSPTQQKEHPQAPPMIATSASV